MPKQSWEANQLDIKKIAGYEGSYRLRVGKYRALYTIIESEVVIFLFDLDSRRGDIYKK